MLWAAHGPFATAARIAQICKKMSQGFTRPAPPDTTQQGGKRKRSANADDPAAARRVRHAHAQRVRCT